MIEAIIYRRFARLERSLDNTERKLQLLREQRVLLQVELVNTKPLTPIVIDGKDLALNPSERLKKTSSSACKQAIRIL